MKKVAFYTLGCKLNYSETSSISRMFENKGFEVVDFSNQPDVFVVNTCSVTENADKKCAKVVREAKKINPESYVVIIGCYAQLKPDAIANMPGVDAVLGAAEKFRLIEVLGQFEKKDKTQVFAQHIEEVNIFEPSYSAHDRTRTFLKVQDGCDYSCSFCTIPLARGSSRSAYVHEIIQQAHEIKNQGVKEVVLTGVNIGDFGLHNGERKETFLDLVQALDNVGIPRIRISSIEPNLLTDEIISFVAGSKSFMPHFHIPLQSGNDKVLSLMRRRYKRGVYHDRVHQIKQLMPHACIGVDVITGFPGEDEEAFLDSFQFINELPVSYLHVFTYSERANTHALNLSGKVPQKTRNDRTTQLRSLSEKKRRLFYEENIGKTALVLFEKEEHENEMFGFTENYVKVKANYDPLRVNELVPVILQDFDTNGETLNVSEAIDQEVLKH